MVGETEPGNPTGHVLHKVTTPRLGDTDLPTEMNTERKPKWGDKETLPKLKGKSSDKDTNDMEASSLPATEFKTVVIRMLQGLGGKRMNSVRT